MSERLLIVPMQAEHLDAVLAIERDSAPHPWTRGIFSDELSNTESRIYRVASVDDTIVGFAGVLVQVGEAHIVNIAVSPEKRRSGIASALMVELLQAAIESGATCATLEVRASNVSAQRLYHRFGFAPSGVRPRYYAGGEDAVIMWTEDITTEEYASRFGVGAAQ